MKLLTAAALLIVAAMAFGQSLRVRAGDSISIVCDREPSFNGEYRVGPDGTIKLAIIGIVPIEGLGEDGAARSIGMAARAFGWSNLAFVVRILAPKEKPVTYGGAVEHTGAIPFRQGLTLKHVLDLATPTATADLTGVVVTNSQGEAKIFDLVGGDKSLPNTELRSGDSIFVPMLAKAKEVYLLGAVNLPGSVQFTAGMNAKQAIGLAGGPTNVANVSRARIVKLNGEEWPLDITVDGRDIYLEPGDKVYVPLLDKSRFISVVGAVASPGPVALSPNMTVAGAIEAAGGFIPGADAKGIRVRRIVGSKDLSALQPYDIIEVPFIGPHDNRFFKAAIGLARLFLVFGK